MLNGDGFIANETVYKRLVPQVYLHIGLQIVSDALGEKRTRYKGAGKHSTRATTNVGWPAVQQVRDVCLFIFYLCLSFCTRPSLFSNNAAPHD